LSQQSQVLANYQESLQKIMTTRSHGVDALAVFDAVFLAKEASDQLHYERNIPAAIQLLTSAKNRLEGVHRAIYQSAIHALTNDIAALDKTEKIDIQSVYLILSNALESVPTLPIAASPNNQSIAVKNKDPAPEKITSETSTSWSQSIKDSWRELKSLVTVQHDSAAIPSVLTYRQSVFLYENISALISQTQYAVLHGDDAIFHENLKQLTEWLTTYFVLTDPKVSDMLLAFKQLQAVNIHPLVPEIQASLTAMAALQSKEVNE
jgi:uroporphyrin-3 C-methyltransferase